MLEGTPSSYLTSVAMGAKSRQSNRAARWVGTKKTTTLPLRNANKAQWNAIRWQHTARMASSCLPAETRERAVKHKHHLQQQHLQQLQSLHMFDSQQLPGNNTTCATTGLWFNMRGTVLLD